MLDQSHYAGPNWQCNYVTSIYTYSIVVDIADLDMTLCSIICNRIR